MVYTFEGIQIKSLGESFGRRSGQDYKTIKAGLKKGVPWVDPDFSEKDPSTLGKKAANSMIFWSRAKDVIPNPVFVKNQECYESKSSRFDIIQGALSDCWFLVAVDVLAEQPALLRMVVPDDNSFDDDNSVFHFRFWKAGQWVEVVVDDRLPCFMAMENGLIVTRVAFARNRENEFWVPLLEKAYAKLYGSFSMLQFGLIGDALVDMTGGICSTMQLRSPTADPPKAILNFLADSYERGALIGLGICIGTNDTGSGVALGAGEIKMANGLARGHAYSVTGLGQVPFQGKEVLLVRVRNPWGTEFEWNGPWSDGSDEWAAFKLEKVINLHLKLGDGEFWMTFKDVMQNFDLLSICHLPARIVKEVVSSEICDPTLWANHEFAGEWTESGNINAVELFKNPQYLLDLTTKSDADTMDVIVSVFNKSIRLTGKDTTGEKFFPVIFSVKTPTEIITKRFPASAMETGMLTQAAKPVPEDMRESFEIHAFPKGRYLIIPSCINPAMSGKIGKYLLRVYTDGNSTLTLLK